MLSLWLDCYAKLNVVSSLNDGQIENRMMCGGCCEWGERWQSKS